MNNSWRVKDKRRLLLAVMNALAGDSHVSFEGDLRGFPLGHITGASDQETAILKRNTLWPRQDFIVVPLEQGTEGTLLRAIGNCVPRRIIHIQIEKAGLLQFAAYDRFGPGSVVFGPGVSPKLLQVLVADNILSS